MISAREACEMAKLENTPVKVGANCDKALNEAVLRAIEAGRNKIDIALGYKECSEDDGTIAAYLKQKWFHNVKVSHDYPWYSESYEGENIY